MPYMFVRATVEDYAAFRDVFDDAEEMRQSARSTGEAVYRSADDRSEVTVQIEFSAVEDAKVLAMSPGLRQAMQKAGVQGPPTIWFVNEPLSRLT